MARNRGVTKFAGLFFLTLSCALKAPPVFLEEIESSGVLLASGELALPQEKVAPIVLDRLRAHGGFALAVDGAGASAQASVGSVKIWAEMGRAEASTKDEVNVLLEIRLKDNDEAFFELTGRAFLTPAPDKNTSVVRALSEALNEAIARSHAIFSAWKKQDVQLLRDLRSKDMVAKNAAIDILAFRRNPAVADALLDRLNSNELVEVRRAMGGLIELREVRAVGPLIELSKSHDLSFFREVLFALGAIGGEEAQGYLFTVAQGHDVPAIREAARQALSEVSTSPERKKP